MGHILPCYRHVPPSFAAQIISPPPLRVVFVRLPLPAVVHTAAMHLAVSLPRGVPTWMAHCANVRRRRREGHQDLRWRTNRQHQEVRLDGSKNALQAEPLTASRSTCKSQLCHQSESNVST